MLVGSLHITAFEITNLHAYQILLKLVKI